MAFDKGTVVHVMHIYVKPCVVYVHLYKTYLYNIFTAVIFQTLSRRIDRRIRVGITARDTEITDLAMYPKRV